MCEIMIMLAERDDRFAAVVGIKMERVVCWRLWLIWRHIYRRLLLRFLHPHSKRLHFLVHLNAHKGASPFWQEMENFALEEESNHNLIELDYVCTCWSGLRIFLVTIWFATPCIVCKESNSSTLIWRAWRACGWRTIIIAKRIVWPSTLIVLGSGQKIEDGLRVVLRSSMDNHLSVVAQSKAPALLDEAIQDKDLLQKYCRLFKILYPRVQCLMSFAWSRLQ